MWDGTDYWREAFEISMEEAGCGELLSQITPEQRTDIAGGLAGCHDNYGMAFYTPPASDRLSAIEREWKEKYARLQKEFDVYRDFTGEKMARALKLRHGDTVSLDPAGDHVTINDGRGTEVWL